MNKKTRNILLILYAIAFISIASASTYAYFSYLKVKHYAPQASVETATLNQILFDTGRQIRIMPTYYNFKEGMGNLSDFTIASAYLKHSEGDAQSSLKYNLVLVIDKNDLTYSTGENNAELLLEVIAPDGSKLEKVDGLDYVSVIDGNNEEIKGFDITTKVGTYYIAKNRELSTLSEIMEKWNIKVTYVNLGKNQNGNLEKELTGYIKIEKSV